MELKAFQFEHLDLFAWREDDYKTYNVGSEFIGSMRDAESKGQCYTAVSEGRIIVIGGVIPHTLKSGYCFSIFSRYAETCPRSAARTVRRMFHAMVVDMGLHRVVTYNRVGAGIHNRWCEWLGFEREGEARKYDDEGNDYIQYALVR